MYIYNCRRSKNRIQSWDLEKLGNRHIGPEITSTGCEQNVAAIIRDHC